MLRDPARVAVTPQATTVERVAAARHPHRSRQPSPRCWPTCSRPRPIDRVLVFTRTKHGADKVVAQLAARPASRPRRSTATSRRTSASACSATSATASCACWSRPTSPPAASTSTASATSSTTTCRTSRKATSTASAAPRAPAPTASRSRSAITRKRAYLRDIEKLIRMAIPATDRRTGGAAQRPSSQAEGRHGGHRGNQQRGNGGGHGRHGNNGHRAHNGGNGHQGRPSQNGHKASHSQAPARKPRQGSQAASEMLHSCSADRAAPQRRSRNRADVDIGHGRRTGWRKKNCSSSTAR